jgi:hypothetical protein
MRGGQTRIQIACHWTIAVPPVRAKNLSRYGKKEILPQERLHCERVFVKQWKRFVRNDSSIVLRRKRTRDTLYGKLLVNLKLQVGFQRGRTAGAFGMDPGGKRARDKQQIPRAHRLDVAIDGSREVDINFFWKLCGDIDCEFSARMLQDVVEIEQVLPSHSELNSTCASSTYKFDRQPVNYETIKTG